MMTFSEIFIIYLAIGAPFAVHSFFGGQMETNVRNAGVSLLKLTFWPVFGTYFIFRLTRNTFRAVETGNERRIAALETASMEIRSDLSILLVSADREMRKSVIEDFDRLCGIALAVAETEPAASLSIPRIFEAADHPSPDLAARCIFRRNQSRIAEHRNRAHASFLTTLDSLRYEPFKSVEIERIRLKVAALLHDDSAPKTIESTTDPVLREKLQEA